MQLTATWSWKQLDAISGVELHAILRLRQQVFVIEQQCIYPDIDEADVNAWHLSGFYKGELIAYLRMLPPQHEDSLPAIGRVLTREDHRNTGLGAELMQQGIAKTRAEHPGKDIYISAQTHLQTFYRRLGFATSGDAYDEDGIPHIDMILKS